MNAQPLQVVYGRDHRPFVVPAYDAKKPQQVNHYHRPSR